MAGLLAASVLVCGCGSARHPPQPSAQRLCSKTRTAASDALSGQIRARIVSPQPADIKCRLAGRGAVLAVEAQTSDQAWVEFDTTQSHFAQVFGPTNIHNKNEQPQVVTGVGPQAFWVPAGHELVTTNAQEGQTGTYVTVSVTRRAKGDAPPLRVAATVARAALAASPPAR